MTDFHPQNIQNPQHNNGKFKIEKMQHFVVKCCIFCGLIMGQKKKWIKKHQMYTPIQSYFIKNYFIFDTDMIKSGKTNKKMIEK